MATASKAAAKSSPKTSSQRAAATAAAASDNLDIAQKIAWYAILAMVFLVPIAMSNWTWPFSSRIS